MTIFWFHKLLKDEDLCQVDFKSIETLTEGNYPMLSVCLWNPFIDYKIIHYNNSLSVLKYMKFLEGKAYYNGIEKIAFDEITLDIGDFYIGDSITFQNGTIIRGKRPNFLNDIPRVSYTSIQEGVLIKCFGLQFQHTNVASATFGFNASIFRDKKIAHPNFSIFFHMPNKTLLSKNTKKVLKWPKETHNDEIFMDFVLQEIKVLKRRSNKKDAPCLSDELNYDETILDDYIQKVGCKAPYQKTKKNFKVCNSTEEMKEASFNKFQKSKKVACKSTETITFDYQEINFNLKGSDWFHFNIAFPDRFEEIVMVQAVGIQTAIGNAGGYIGLFLGKTRFHVL